MKKIFGYAGALIATAILSIIGFVWITSNEEESQDSIRLTFHSEILSEDRDLIVHLPRNYDSAAAYPVMYVLDGGSQDFHMANAFSVLTTAGYVDKTIVIGIPNMTNENRERDLTPPFMRRDNDDPNSAMGEGDTFMKFFEQELIPFVEGRYRTSGVRMISGNSRGGLFAMYTLLQKPEMFDARFCFSTPFWRQDAVMVSKMKELLTAQDTLNTFIYMSVGTNETDNIRNGMNAMDSTLNDSASKGVVSLFDHTENAGHQDNAIISMPRAIRKWSEYNKKI